MKSQVPGARPYQFGFRSTVVWWFCNKKKCVPWVTPDEDSETVFLLAKNIVSRGVGGREGGIFLEDFPPFLCFEFLGV